MTYISLREVFLLQLLQAVVLLAAGAIALFLMDLRNTRNAAVIQARHAAEVQVLQEDKGEALRRINELDSQIRLLTSMLLSSRTLTPKDAQLITSMSHAQGPTNRLFTAMEMSFSVEDLQVLCFDMGITYENLTGTNLDTRIIGLINEATRTGRLDELIEKVKERRPDLKLQIHQSEKHENP